MLCYLEESQRWTELYKIPELNREIPEGFTAGRLQPHLLEYLTSTAVSPRVLGSVNMGWILLVTCKTHVWQGKSRLRGKTGRAEGKRTSVLQRGAGTQLENLLDSSHPNKAWPQVLIHQVSKSLPFWIFVMLSPQIIKYWVPKPKAEIVAKKPALCLSILDGRVVDFSRQCVFLTVWIFLRCIKISGKFLSNEKWLTDTVNYQHGHLFDIQKCFLYLKDSKTSYYRKYPIERQ